MSVRLELKGAPGTGKSLLMKVITAQMRNYGVRVQLLPDSDHKVQLCDIDFNRLWAGVNDQTARPMQATASVPNLIDPAALIARRNNMVSDALAEADKLKRATVLLQKYPDYAERVELATLLAELSK